MSGYFDRLSYLAKCAVDLPSPQIKQAKLMIDVISKLDVKIAAQLSISSCLQFL